MKAVGLRLRAGARLLVDGLDWEARPGECWCVIGRNGAGKSTLLRTLAGLRQPDAGTVERHGRALPAWPLQKLARERAYLPQGRVDAFGYSALDTVLSARHPYHGGAYWESEEDLRAARDALCLVDAGDLAARDVRTLSGGERQRVAIAAALAQDTPLLLLDEPANALDLAHQVQIMELLSGLCRDSGKTVVMVGHDLNLARGAASHALLLMGDGGWQAGSVDEVMNARLLQRCLGHPIDILEHDGRLIYIPSPAADDRRVRSRPGKAEGGGRGQ